MTVSELISELQSFLKTHGDHEVWAVDGAMGSYTTDGISPTPVAISDFGTHSGAPPDESVCILHI